MRPWSPLHVTTQESEQLHTAAARSRGLERAVGYELEIWLLEPDGFWCYLELSKPLIPVRSLC